MKATIRLTVLFVLLTGFIYAQDLNFSFKEEYSLQEPATVILASFDGNIEALPATGNKTEVFYIVTKNSSVLKITRKELENEKIFIDIIQNGNSLELKVRNENDYGLFNFMDYISVSFKIYVPKNTACDLRTSDGNISLTGLTSNQSCKTSDGNLVISDITGQLKGSTSDGNINVRGITGSTDLRTSDGNIVTERITGDLQAFTSDGNVSLTKVSGDVHAKTSDGDINFSEISGSLEAGTSDGNIKGNMIGLKKQLIAKTSDGNIHISIPSKLGLDLNIKGESLDVPLTNFSGKSNEKSIEGQMNGGGIAVNLSTSDGRVSLAYQ